MGDSVSSVAALLITPELSDSLLVPFACPPPYHTTIDPSLILSVILPLVQLYAVVFSSREYFSYCRSSLSVFNASWSGCCYG